jgi:hypothetical protein
MIENSFLLTETYSEWPAKDPLLLLTREQLLSVTSFRKLRRLSFVTTSRMCCDVSVLASLDVVTSAVDVIMYSRNLSKARAKFY